MSSPVSAVPDQLIDVRPGDEQDWGALEAHLRTVFELPVDPMGVHQFRGGSANLTYLVTFGETRLVVRRPPRGTLAPGSHDMAREYRVLSKLPDAYRRAPRALHFTDDESVIGAPFLVVEYRDGIVIRGAVPEGMTRHDDVERRIDLALVDAAAELHSVEPEAVGLGDVGQPEGFGRRQIDGWRARWQRVAPADGTGTIEEIADRLTSTLPPSSCNAIVHNDLKLDNCQFQPDDPDVVTTVFDWDMATLGDPLFDLGLLVVSMSSSPLWVLSREAVAERYAERSGLDVEHLDWYVAFATWRTAIVLQQLYDRFLTGHTTDERCASFGAVVPVYVEQARDLLG